MNRFHGSGPLFWSYWGLRSSASLLADDMASICSMVPLHWNRKNIFFTGPGLDLRESSERPKLSINDLFSTVEVLLSQVIPKALSNQN